MTEELKNIDALTGPDRYLAFNEYADKLQKQCFDKIVEKSDALGFNRNHIKIGNHLGIDPTSIKRCLEGSQVLKIDDCSLIAYKFLEQSCNEYYFGETKPIILPKTLSSIAQMLEKLSKKDLAKMEQLTVRLYCQGTNLHIIDQAWKVVNYRLQEMAIDRGVKISQLCNKANSMNSNFSQRLRSVQKWFADGQPEEISKLTLRSVAYAAFELDQSLDYFYAQDYLTYSEIGYYTFAPQANDHPLFPNQELHIVSNLAIREIIRKYLFFNDVAKNAFQTELFILFLQ